MSTKKIKLINILKESFKDDTAADIKMDAIEKTGAFQNLLSNITSNKDLSRAIEAFIKAIKEKKQQIAKSASADSNLKQVDLKLNQTQGDKTTVNQQPATQK
jgi:hypothetical protein